MKIYRTSHTTNIDETTGVAWIDTEGTPEDGARPVAVVWGRNIDWPTWVTWFGPGTKISEEFEDS